MNSELFRRGPSCNTNTVIIILAVLIFSSFWHSWESTTTTTTTTTITTTIQNQGSHDTNNSTTTKTSNATLTTASGGELTKKQTLTATAPTVPLVAVGWNDTTSNNTNISSRVSPLPGTTLPPVLLEGSKEETKDDTYNKISQNESNGTSTNNNATISSGNKITTTVFVSNHTNPANITTSSAIPPPPPPPQKEMDAEETTSPPIRFPDGKWNYERIEPLNITTLTAEQEAVLQNLQQQENDNGDHRGGGATTCAWKWNASDIITSNGEGGDDDCLELLAKATRNVTRWYFLGDSTMTRPWQYCFPQLLNRTYLKTAAGTQVKEYLEISPEETLSSLKQINVSKGEGPSSRKNFYKSGCTTCQNRLIQYSKNHSDSSNGTPTTTAYAEFLSMDFARDVEFATKTLDTTQQVIARYMERQRRSAETNSTTTACVLSFGMHDIVLTNLTDAMYLENFRAMYTMMKEHCNVWIQLELTAKGYRLVNERDSRRIHLWNEGIRRILQPHDYQIQLFQRSLNSQHGDNVHMDIQTFYVPLANFFFSLMNAAIAR